MFASWRTLGLRLRQRMLMSLNDPQWGRKPGASPGGSGESPAAEPHDRNEPPRNEARNNGGPDGGSGGGGGRPGGPGGPPDLDELLKKVNDRIAEIFGGKKRRAPLGGGSGGGGPQLPSISPKFAAGGVGILAAGAILLWLASGFYVVDDRERGIVQRFGKYHATTGPGLNWRLPWPIDTVTKVRLTDVRNVEIGGKGNQRSGSARQSLMLTEDLNIIDITFTVQYVLNDARAYLFNDRRPDQAVIQSAESAMREVVGRYKMDFLLSQGREKVASDARQLLQDILNRYGTGITIRTLNLQSAAPEAVVEAFQDVVKAQQDAERVRNEGQAYANRVVPEARGRASRLLEEAAAYEQTVVSRAEGDAARFRAIVAEYNKAPAVTRERLYIDMMQSVLGNSSKVLVDQKSGGNSLLYLPLDRLMQATREAAGATPELPAPALAPTPPAASNGNTDRGTGRDTRGGRDSRN
ncbi:MAG: FtsH protease activity modulator HflK [Casimicrobiaceae bacterium]